MFAANSRKTTKQKHKSHLKLYPGVAEDTAQSGKRLLLRLKVLPAAPVLGVTGIAHRVLGSFPTKAVSSRVSEKSLKNRWAAGTVAHALYPSFQEAVPG